MTAGAATALADYRVMGAIGSGHFLSHFFLLCLPPLFPLIKDEFGVSYAALGLAVTLLNTFTGLGQVPVGFLVDRLGARRLLLGGMTILSLSIALIGFTSSYPALLALACLAGLGNAVFHPADYAILSASVNEGRIGRAFGVHMLGGSVGFAAAPTVIVLLASLWDWRTGLLAAGLAGLAVTAAVGSQSGVMRDEGHARARDPGRGEGGKGAAGGAPAAGRAGLLSLPVLLFFLFFLAAALNSQGLQAFLVTGLVQLHATPLAAANGALTAYLVGGVAGTAAGGVLADRTRRHTLVTLVSMLATAAFLLAIGTVDLGAVGLTAATAAAGFLQGLYRPSRDMLVRAITPPGSMGRVFGFVSSGLHLGGTVAPVLFGWIIDLGRPEMVFLVLAAILALSCLTLLGAGRGERPAAAARPAE
ncbi:MAG: MFS transporter [Proteobacteria bacterium]|nr:MFS transporter [Pseudomonadota bacterium]